MAGSEFESGKGVLIRSNQCNQRTELLRASILSPGPTLKFAAQRTLGACFFCRFILRALCEVSGAPGFGSSFSPHVLPAGNLTPTLTAVIHIETSNSQICISRLHPSSQGQTLILSCLPELSTRVSHKNLNHIMSKVSATHQHFLSPMLSSIIFLCSVAFITL